ncbi:MAG: alpha-glucosidase C-terminal domain-containing protein, partial [Rhodanobacter sp.]
HGTPWLPVPPEHRALAVSRQNADPHSVLNGFRTFMHWRQAQPALRWGDIEFLDTPEPVLAFTRRLAEQTVLVVFNLAEIALTVELPDELACLQPLDGHGLKQGCLDGVRLQLPGHGAWFASAR